MKYRINLSALLLAILFLLASNGVAVFEHICNASNTRSFCMFSQPACEKETASSPCCEKLGLKKKNNCCEHKQFFSKLNVEGFTAKQLQLKPIEKEINGQFLCSDFLHSNQQILEDHYSGTSPPGNLFTIKYLLRPTPIELQIFRC